MIDAMWLLLTFGPLVWMALIAAIFGWEGEGPPWAQLLVLYSKAICINIGILSVCLPWLGTASSAGGVQ